MNRKINRKRINYFYLRQLGLLIVLIIILRGLYVFFRSDYYFQKREREACNKIKGMEFYGIVDSINNSHYLKMRYFFIENNDEKFSMRRHSTSFLEKGDSIIKRKNEPQYIIFKKETFFKDSIVLRFDCN